jgi:hypothetical protein
MGNVRNGTDRRGTDRGTDRREAIDPFRIGRMMAENAERISALLTFPPTMLARDADANRENAGQLAECNRFLSSLLSEGN